MPATAAAAASIDSTVAPARYDGRISPKSIWLRCSEECLAHPLDRRRPVRHDGFEIGAVVEPGRFAEAAGDALRGHRSSAVTGRLSRAPATVDLEIPELDGAEVIRR